MRQENTRRLVGKTAIISRNWGSSLDSSQGWASPVEVVCTLPPNTELAPVRIA